MSLAIVLSCFLLHGVAGPQESDVSADELLRRALQAEGIRVDLERALVAIPATVLVREELLEYLLVGPRGATHEGLFLTHVTPSLLNAALLAVGAEPGRNAEWIEAASAAGEDAERAPDALERAGARTGRAHEVRPPEGDGFLLYAAWREGEESYLFRVDDLLANLETGRSMRRHRWVFLGSRFARPAPGEPEVFVADLEQNLACVSFFFQGNALVTAALPECEQQTIWIANSWLVPPRETPVELVFAREPLTELPPAWRAVQIDGAAGRGQGGSAPDEGGPGR